jgi:hypothetical protein
MTIPCPVNGQPGKSLDTATVKAMLSVSLRAVRAVDYLFCRAPDCAVVYYAADGAQTFSVDEVREPVYQKRPAADDVLICYCFRHTAGEVRNATPARRSEISEDIVAGIQAGQCACDLRNPEGTCYLGSVKALMASL